MPLNISGTSGISGIDGSAGTPAIQGSDSNTGISFGTDTVNINTGGATRATIDSSGRLLVGTASAASTGLAQYARFQIEGGTSFNAARLALRSASVNGAEGTNSVIGEILFTESGGGPFASIKATQDAAGGSGDYPGCLRFETTADSASSPTERVRITQAGHIGLFGTDPAATEVRGLTSGYGFRIQRNSYLESAFDNNGYWILNNTQGAGTRYMVAFRTSGGDRGYITSDGTGVSYSSLSDYRLKENVTPVTDGITRLQQLKPSRFNFIANPGKTVDGFLAHEAQTVVPECVTGVKDEVDADGNPVYQGIDQSKLVPLLTAALQEAIAKIETLETRLTALEGGVE